MKVKRVNRGYTMFLTDHEFRILNRMTSVFDIDKEWLNMDSGERRSWARRIRGGKFLREDIDARTVKF